jgi:hypothetical protein
VYSLWPAQSALIEEDKTRIFMQTFSVGLRCTMTAKPVTNIQSIALRTIRLEAEAIAALEEMVGAEFEKAILSISNAKGRLVISGIEKVRL